jgi:hypothetical protein
MMAPFKRPAPTETDPADKDLTIVEPKLSSATSPISIPPIEFSKPVRRPKPASRKTVPVISTNGEDILRKEAEAQARKLVAEEEEEATKVQGATEKSQSEHSPKADTAPLGKLATRMKSLLRRNTSEKKKEKKGRTHPEVDRLEDIHWSEM